MDVDLHLQRPSGSIQIEHMLVYGESIYPVEVVPVHMLLYDMHMSLSFMSQYHGLPSPLHSTTTSVFSIVLHGSAARARAGPVRGRHTRAVVSTYEMVTHDMGTRH